jgi:citrate lyase synthetase
MLTRQYKPKPGDMAARREDQNRVFSKSRLKQNLATNDANSMNFFVPFVTFVAAWVAQRCDRQTLKKSCRLEIVWLNNEDRGI